MSMITGSQSEVLFANGFAYPVANASSTSSQALITGASAKYGQPYFPGGYLQQSRSGQVAAVEFAIILAGQAAATTAIFTAGLATAANSSGGNTLVAANPVSCTSFSGGTVHGRILISNFGSGYSLVNSTNLWSTISLIANNSSTTGGAAAAGGPTELFPASGGVDFSANQWLYLTVTFSTSSTSNSAQLQQLVVFGLNLSGIRGGSVACFDQADATNILAAILNNVAYVTVTATKLRLGTNTPTATSNMTELGGGTGYTTGGSAISWNAVSAASTSNSGSVSWTNSGTTWTLVGLEIWDTAGPLRHLWGTWSGGSVTVANGNTFQVSAAGISVSLVLCIFVL